MGPKYPCDFKISDLEQVLEKNMTFLFLTCVSYNIIGGTAPRSCGTLYQHYLIKLIKLRQYRMYSTTERGWGGGGVGDMRG